MYMQLYIKYMYIIIYKCYLQAVVLYALKLSIQGVASQYVIYITELTEDVNICVKTM